MDDFGGFGGKWDAPFATFFGDHLKNVAELSERGFASRHQRVTAREGRGLPRPRNHHPGGKEPFCSRAASSELPKPFAGRITATDRHAQCGLRPVSSTQMLLTSSVWN